MMLTNAANITGIRTQSYHLLVLQCYTSLVDLLSSVATCMESLLAYLEPLQTNFQHKPSG